MVEAGSAAWALHEKDLVRGLGRNCFFLDGAKEESFWAAAAGGGSLAGEGEETAALRMVEEAAAMAKLFVEMND